VTNTLTCGALLATGDFLQQKIEKAQGQNQGLDKTRCGMVGSHFSLMTMCNGFKVSFPKVPNKISAQLSNA